LALCPPLDLGSEPELDTTLAEVDDRSRHVFVSLLILADGIAVGEFEDVGDALSVEEMLCLDFGGH
jgi:hypothetical protein